MPTEPFTNVRCWDTASVQETLRTNIAQLGLDEDAVFLAAHSEIPLTQKKGRSVEATEKGVLQALEDELERNDLAENSIIAIIGEAGSGKSHLVRWVHHQLPKSSSDYKVIWIPRESRQTAQILERLLGEMRGIDAADQIARRVSTNAELSQDALADRVHFAITQELIHNSTDTGQGGQEWLLGEESNGQGRSGLGRLLSADPLKFHLKEDGGIIQDLVNSLRIDQEGRDQVLPEFTREHFPTDNPEVEKALKGLAKVDSNLKRPIEIWQGLRQLNILDDVVKICNDYLGPAMQEVIGIGKEGQSPLGEAFVEFREELRKEGKQLVLLFEDLAVFQMMDGWIYDLFREGPGSDLAPVRAVFAMTNLKYLERVPEGVKGVETFHFELSTFDLSGGSDDAISFAARWLNAGRLGKSDLKQQMESATPAKRRNNTWLKIKCDTCEYEEDCRSTFKDVKGIGLYPFNKTALESALKKTEQIQIDKGEHLTPRAIMFMLREVLEESEEYLSEEIFPGTAFDAGGHHFEWDLRKPESQIAPSSEEVTDEDYRRILRTRVIWADQAKESDGVRRAFGLPELEGGALPHCAWCGSELNQVDDAWVDETGEATCADNPDGGTHQTSSDDGPVRNKKIDNKKRTQLLKWHTEPGRKLIDNLNTQLRTALYEAVKARVNYQWLLVAPSGAVFSGLLESVLHRNSFNIENSTGHPQGLKFELKKNEDVTKLLFSVLWLDDHNHWRTDDPGLFSDNSELVTWEFPYEDVGNCQVLYEEYVSTCAREVEEELKRLLAREPSETVTPVDMAVAFSTIARRCLGCDELPPETDAEAWYRCVAHSVDGILPCFSQTWQPVADVAMSCLRTLAEGTNYATDLASAHQGTGKALVLDVGTTRELANKAWTDPVSFLHGMEDPPDGFPTLREIHKQLCDAVSEEVCKNEVGQLLEQVDSLLGYLNETEPRQAAADAWEVGSRARDEGLFRPQADLQKFGDATNPEREHAEAYSLTELQDLREALVANQESTVTAFESLRDGERLSQLKSDFEVIGACLDKSLTYAQGLVGGGPTSELQAKYGDVADRLEEVADTIREVFG